MSKDKSNYVDVPLEFTIPGETEDDAAVTGLRIKRPKTRHIIKLAAIVGKDIAGFIASADGKDAKQKLAKLSEGDAIGDLLSNLLTEEYLDRILDLLADLCGITPKQAGEIDLEDQIAIFKALAGFFTSWTVLTS